MRPVALATAPILALLLLGNAAAESRAETSARCADPSAPPDLAIAACTALIKGARELTGHLVDHYVNRGIAYAMKPQCDQAIEDYDRAIELDHRHATSSTAKTGAVYLTITNTGSARDTLESARPPRARAPR